MAIACVCVCHDWQDADRKSGFTAVFVFKICINKPRAQQQMVGGRVFSRQDYADRLPWSAGPVPSVTHLFMGGLRCPGLDI